MSALSRLSGACCCLALVGCTEITSDGPIGTIDSGWFVSGEDTIRYDAAADLKGVWFGGFESEEENVYYLDHVGAGSLKVWIHEWENGDLKLSSTLAVVSVLDGDQYLNVVRVHDGRLDSLRYWNFRFVLNDSRLRMHVIDEEFLERAHEAGRLTTADTVESGLVTIHSTELSELLHEFEWEPWVVDEVMIFRQLASELPD